MITYTLLSVEPMGFSNSSARLVMKKDDPKLAYRKASFTVANDQIETVVKNIDENLTDFWNNGVDISEQEFRFLKGVALKEYYRNILDKVYKTEVNKTGIDSTIAMGLEAVADNGEAQALFQVRQAAIELAFTGSSRQVILLQEIRLFALEGLLSGN